MLNASDEVKQVRSHQEYRSSNRNQGNSNFNQHRYNHHHQKHPLPANSQHGRPSMRGGHYYNGTAPSQFQQANHHSPHSSPSYHPVRGAPPMNGDVPHFFLYPQPVHTPINDFNGQEVSQLLTSNWELSLRAAKDPQIPAHQKPIIAHGPSPLPSTQTSWGANKAGCLANGQPILAVLRGEASPNPDQ